MEGNSQLFQSDDTLTTGWWCQRYQNHCIQANVKKFGLYIQDEKHRDRGSCGRHYISVIVEKQGTGKGPSDPRL